MSFKLTKSEEQDRADRTAELRKLATALKEQINAYNNTMADARAALEKALGEYNEQLGEVRGFCEDVASRIDGEYDDKSESWQEGERAQAVQSWKEEWEGVDLDDVDIDFPEDIEGPELDHAGAVDNIDAEPNY